MNFWTPERCKTLTLMQLIDNSLEISAQAAISRSETIAARKLEIVEMIQAEIRTRSI